jgi:hypothetical protein
MTITIEEKRAKCKELIVRILSKGEEMTEKEVFDRLKETHFYGEKRHPIYGKALVIRSLEALEVKGVVAVRNGDTYRAGKRYSLIESRNRQCSNILESGKSRE